MNKKKIEEKRIKRGLLTSDEHIKKRSERRFKTWSKNPKNKGKQKFIMQ